MSVVLLNRGIDSEEKLKSYLTKSLGGIYNPMLFPQMETACERVKKAIAEGEKIVVYGDYDVDGITSSALLLQFLREMGANAEYYIPDRMKEGYGLNVMAVNRIAKGGAGLLITVDCGITSVGEVELAKALKMDVIVTDHHTCKEKLPAALAVINPKVPGCGYPFKELAGVGVAFKFVMALAKSMGKNAREYFDKYAELAAIGTIADVVALKEENRIIVDRGLKQLAATHRPGLKAVMSLTGMDTRTLTSTAAAFILAPRLNAAGRMGSASTAAELILTENADTAQLLAAELDETNKQRQLTEQKIYKEALELLQADADFYNKRIIVLKKEGWHHGVIGIAAARLCERFYRPCILLGAENGKCKGSGRSVEGFNLFDALSECDELLTAFGGHALAAGLSLDEKDFEEFSSRINKYASKVLAAEKLVRSIDIDCSVPPEYITLGNARLLERLEPYGEGNEKPVFALCGAKISSIVTMGADNRHLRIKFSTSAGILEGVGFGMGDYASKFRAGDTVDAAFTLDINTFRGEEKVQMLLKAVRQSEG